MKNFFLRITGVIMVGLIVLNLFVVISGIVISDDINNFEKEVASLSSLQFAQTQAKEFDFTNSSLPQYIDQLKYAYR